MKEETEEKGRDLEEGYTPSLHMSTINQVIHCDSCDKSRDENAKKPSAICLCNSCSLDTGADL